MGSDFDLSDLLKPHLSPALPHWKRTRVSAGQLDHNITIASTLTFQASLITSTTPHWKRTRVSGRSNVNAWPWKPHLSPRRWVSQRRIGQDYWQVHKWKGQNAAQSLGEVATQRLYRQPRRRGPPFLLTNKSSSTQGGRVGIFFTLNQAYWVKHTTEGKCFYNE